MSNDWPAPWGDAVTCAMCGWRLKPPRLTRASAGDEAMGIAKRPDVKCPSCGQCYQWQDSCGWVPTGNTDCVATPEVYELTGHALRRPTRKVRSAPEKSTAAGTHRRR
jgi:hypothetical protein